MLLGEPSEGQRLVCREAVEVVEDDEPIARTGVVTDPANSGIVSEGVHADQLTDAVSGACPDPRRHSDGLGSLNEGWNDAG
ncbi:MAG: hypothetical protein ACJAV2_003704 [Myxococcota bacterium]